MSNKRKIMKRKTKGGLKTIIEREDENWEHE
jgi:hypothetical protein